MLRAGRNGNILGRMTTIPPWVAAVPPAPRFPAVLWAWQLEPVTLALLVASAVLYLAGERRVAELHPRNPWRQTRTWAFLAGLVVLAVALLSPLATYAEVLFSVHMVQHLLIVFVAAPLIVAGAPVRLALRTLPREGRDALVRLLHSRAARAIGHPLVAWSIFAAVMLGTHIPAFYDLSLIHI